MLFERLQVPVNNSSADRNGSDERANDVSVLVIGAAGGVGSILTQLLKTRTSATVIGTASRDESVQWLKDAIDESYNLRDLRIWL